MEKRSVSPPPYTVTVFPMESCKLTEQNAGQETHGLSSVATSRYQDLRVEGNMEIIRAPYPFRMVWNRAWEADYPQGSPRRHCPEQPLLTGLEHSTGCARKVLPHSTAQLPITSPITLVASLALLTSPCSKAWCRFGLPSYFWDPQNPRM